MAYNPGFPATYPQYYPQYNPQLNSYQNPQNNGIIWVQGVEAAKAYQIAPGVTLPLWDSDAQVIYLKSCDASGMPSMRILDYTIRAEASKKAQNALSGTGGTILPESDLNALQSRIDALERKIASIERSANESTVQRTESAAAKQPVTAVSTVPADIPG